MSIKHTLQKMLKTKGSNYETKKHYKYLLCASTNKVKIELNSKNAESKVDLA